MHASHRPDCQSFFDRGEPRAHQHHSVSDQLAADTGDARRAGEVFRRAPNCGAKNSAAIQGETRQQIESGHGKIDLRQPLSQRTKRVAVGRKQGQAGKERAQRVTGERAGDGDVEFLDGFRRLAADARHSPKNETA